MSKPNTWRALPRHRGQLDQLMGRPRVLIVDDQRYIRKSLSAFLQRRGYAVRTATRVDQAIDVVERAVCHLDAAILDIRLSGHRSGVEVLAHLRTDARWASALVLILTGAALTSAEEDAIRRLGGYVFHKPEGYGVLADYLDALIDRSRSRAKMAHRSQSVRQ